MVRDKQMAVGDGRQPEFPGGKYPSLFLFFVAPSTGRSVEENEKELYQIIEQVKTTKTDEETLTRIKTKLRAHLIRKLASNTGLAVELCSYYVTYRDWRKLFSELADYNKITAANLQRAAQRYLV